MKKEKKEIYDKIKECNARKYKKKRLREHKQQGHADRQACATSDAFRGYSDPSERD